MRFVLLPLALVSLLCCCWIAFALPPTAFSGPSRLVKGMSESDKVVGKKGMFIGMFADPDDESSVDDEKDEDDVLSSSSSSSSESASVSSSSGQQDEDGEDDVEGASSSSSEAASDEDADEFVENVAGWRPAAATTVPTPSNCPKGKFLEADGAECRPCSICGPDLYEREHCSAQRDTLCDWCLGPGTVRNADFRAKCLQLIALRNEFRTALKQQRPALGAQSKPALFTVSLEGASKWMKAELLVEMAFYVALIALVLAVIRFLAKNRPTSYRTVTVTPPALEEWEQKNIVRAAESIRDKLGNKGYSKLEEEFI